MIDRRFEYIRNQIIDEILMEQQKSKILMEQQKSNNEKIQQLKEDIAINKEKLQKLEELQRTKSPAEEAYKRLYGCYPITGIDDGSGWTFFQDGYDAAFFEGCKVEEPEEKEQKWDVDKLQEKNWYVDAKDLIERGTTPQEPEENKWKTVALLFGRKLPVILPYSYDELSPDAWFRWVVFTYDNYMKQREIESGYSPTPLTPDKIEESLREAFKKVQQTEEWKETQRKIDSNYEEKVEEEPKPMNEVLDRLENKYKDAEENAASYITDDVVNRMLKEWEENPPDFLKFELGKTLEGLISDWMDDCVPAYSTWDYELGIAILIQRIEKWLPDFQSAAGSQNVDTELLVDGFNDCLTKIKSKLRNKK